MQSRHSWQSMIVVSAALLASAGCASVSVQKIDQAGQATGPSGVRLYRPRPYLSVHEPFAVSAKAYAASGVVSADGKFIAITSVPAELQSRVAAETAGTGNFPASRVLLATPGSGNLQSEPSGPEPKPAEDQKDKPSERTGQGQLKVQNDNAAFAVQPLRRYFDIVYLPDFDEDYVVQVNPRFGNASASVQLGQSWSLQGLDAKVDNDAITRRLFSLYDESIKILLSVGKTALGVPGGLQNAPDNQSPEDRLPRGQPVAVKITVVRMAAPGVYPFLKPAEGRYIVDKFNDLKAKFTELESRILVPIYPMTTVAFNTYEVLVVEAAVPVGDSPLRFHQYDSPGGQARTPAAREGGSAGIDLNNTDHRRALEQTILNALKADGLPVTDVAITPGSQNTGRYQTVPALQSFSDDQQSKIRTVVEQVTATAPVTLTP